MARLHYMSLPGVGEWHEALRQVLAQFRPYEEYLAVAIRAAEQRKPVLAWRPATQEELEEFERRLQERHDDRVNRASRAARRRDRRVSAPPTGEWIVLEPAPWRPEESDETFDSFFDAREVFTAPDCVRDFRIEKRSFDREGRALLLERLPEAFQPDDQRGGALGPATAVSPRGRLLWLAADTLGLKRQRDALRDVENAPSPRFAPLIRLTTTTAAWPNVEPESIDQWVFLKTSPSGELRDGTEEQRRFVQIALATKDFAILEGPPGSGKTTAICELIVQLVRRGLRVLLVASTHVAVDNVLERLIAWQDSAPPAERHILPVRIGDEDRITSDSVVPWTYRRFLRTLRDDLLDFLESPKGVQRAGDEARRILRTAIERPRNELAVGFEERAIERLLLESANLVCGTTIGIQAHPAIRAAVQQSLAEPFEPFDVMILDEASKTTFAEFLVPARHACKWIISGDVKQLSPYVEELDLAENVRRLVPERNARAAVHAFLAAADGGYPRRASVLAVADEKEADLVRREADARSADFVDLDHRQPVSLRGVEGAIPELLHANLVIATPATLRGFEHRLPIDDVTIGGDVPDLADWDAALDACAGHSSSMDQVDDPPDWASELSWRMVRAYELRQNHEERGKYEKEIEALLPVTLGEPERNKLLTSLDTIRRVTMPSILELLQEGAGRLQGWSQSVALTHGLPETALRQRKISLSYQHRMHPEISVFPREQFYMRERMVSLDPRIPDSWAEILGDEGFVRRTEVLLQDASALDREWSYTRYARRALWIDVPPDRRRRGGNASPAEARRLVEELRAFAEWARDNPRLDDEGRERPWEVAALTFYRGQEALLRGELRRLSGQHGNTRNFVLPRGARRGAHVTLCTVDRFQGHEADLVLLSFVKSGRSVGFLNSPNRLNVGLTRARYQLVLVGHRAALARSNSALVLALANSEHYRGDIAWEQSA